jgi:hypothetical protein
VLKFLATLGVLAFTALLVEAALRDFRAAANPKESTHERALGLGLAAFEVAFAAGLIYFIISN